MSKIFTFSRVSIAIVREVNVIAVNRAVGGNRSVLGSPDATV
jgi:hypothetical protein